MSVLIATSISRRQTNQKRIQRMPRMGRVSSGDRDEPPDIAVGPFLHLWPSSYWSCAVDTSQAPIQAPCDSTGANADGADFGFSFGNGYLGTARQPAYRFVTAYYVGCGLPEFWCSLLSGF